jgi:hypothetical protein
MDIADAAVDSPWRPGRQFKRGRFLKYLSANSSYQLTP